MDSQGAEGVDGGRGPGRRVNRGVGHCVVDSRWRHVERRKKKKKKKIKKFQLRKKWEESFEGSGSSEGSWLGQ